MSQFTVNLTPDPTFVLPESSLLKLAHDNAYRSRGTSSESAPPQTPPRPKPAPVVPPTPSHTSSHDGHRAYNLVSHLKTVVGAELGFAFVAEDAVSLPLQHHLEASFTSGTSITEAQIMGWLNSTPLYDPVSERWTCIPENTTAEKDLYESMVGILNAVISHFGHSTRSDASGKIIQRRLAKDTHRYSLPHNILDAANPASPLKTQPDVCILASGGCITNDPAIPEDLSYADVAEIYDGKLNASFLEPDRQQMGVYAREAFIQQMNRNFVRVNIFTPNDLRVLHFDRGGCFYSQRINYHTNPVFLVRLILLGSSFNEAYVGFDRSIGWDHGRRKLQMKPNQLFLNGEWVDNIDETSFEFDVDPIPIFARRTIRSRGTVCWRGTHGGKVFVIKTYWRGEGRSCESQFLRDFIGIKGVPQLLAFEDGGETIKTLRGLPIAEDMIADCKPPRVVVNRTFTRIVIPEYGGTLEQATCAHHFVCAVRDIVIAHRHIATSLPEAKRVLQADISPANLRLAYGEGELGVLIDFDLAKRISHLVDGSAETVDVRTGTPRYQSIRVHLRDQPILSHRQPLDDLESIYYVIYEALYGYDENAKQIPELPFGSEWLRSLTANDKELASLKNAFLYLPLWRVRRFPADAVVLKEMMDDLRRMFCEHAHALAQLIVAHQEDPGMVPDLYDLAKTLPVYEQFLRAIDQAKTKLKEAGPYLRPPTPPPVKPPAGIRKTSANKRKGGSSQGEDQDEDEADYRPSKRSSLVSGQAQRRSRRVSIVPGQFFESPAHEKDDSDQDEMGSGAEPASPTPVSRKLP
uniref:Fungal-type protein kinase domain-containing protein n=1 Tax=Mycena chlorophos TaxID=658473 RepID=A0ABQ0LX25_MYCCL|nr:predicted protein [Mycena chlorophos]